STWRVSSSRRKPVSARFRRISLPRAALPRMRATNRRAATHEADLQNPLRSSHRTLEPQRRTAGLPAKLPLALRELARGGLGDSAVAGIETGTRCGKGASTGGEIRLRFCESGANQGSDAVQLLALLLQRWVSVCVLRRRPAHVPTGHFSLA